MKLYVENGEVFFDFTDIDIKAELDLKVSAYRKFLRDTQCNWKFTEKWNIMRMDYEPYTWATEYGNYKRYESLLKSCIFTAKDLGYIEVSPAVEELLQQTAVRCKELYDAELAMEKERERQAKWESVCKNGCSGCKNLCRCGDDYICSRSREMLPEKNVPSVARGQYVLFNYKPFPTDNCLYNVNKTKEEKIA